MNQTCTLSLFLMMLLHHMKLRKGGNKNLANAQEIYNKITTKNQAAQSKYPDHLKIKTMDARRDPNENLYRALNSSEVGKLKEGMKLSRIQKEQINKIIPSKRKTYGAVYNETSPYDHVSRGDNDERDDDVKIAPFFSFTSSEGIASGYSSTNQPESFLNRILTSLEKNKKDANNIQSAEGSRNYTSFNVPAKIPSLDFRYPRDLAAGQFNQNKISSINTALASSEGLLETLDPDWINGIYHSVRPLGTPFIGSDGNRTIQDYNVSDYKKQLEKYQERENNLPDGLKEIYPLMMKALSKSNGKYDEKHMKNYKDELGRRNNIFTNFPELAYSDGEIVKGYTGTQEKEFGATSGDNPTFGGIPVFKVPLSQRSFPKLTGIPETNYHILNSAPITNEDTELKPQDIPFRPHAGIRVKSWPWSSNVN
jgi:hypothetical protein